MNEFPVTSQATQFGIVSPSGEFVQFNPAGNEPLPRARADRAAPAFPC